MTAKLRLSELYTSIQGEGPNAGLPVQFVRFAGCNLKCPGWPCDTQHAIDPKIFEKEQELLTPGALFERVRYGARLCLTGGEPFLQNDAALEAFTWMCIREGGGMDIECFSNGTLAYPDWAFSRMTFVMDWKLPGSGESHVGINNRWENIQRFTTGDSIKFVCTGEDDYYDAKNLIEEIRRANDKPQLYFGAAWGKLKEATLAEWMTKDNLQNVKMNIQMHNYIWPVNERAR